MISRQPFYVSNYCRTFVLLLALLTILSGCGGGGNSSNATVNGTGGAATGQAKWTYMVYVAGDNNLAAAALMDLREMKAVGSTAAVNVVVQAKLNPTQLKNAGVDAALADSIGSSIYRSKIIKNSNPNSSLLASDFQPVAGISNMADKNVLTGFIQWAKQTYPADNYALVLWSHGNGWKTLPLSTGLPTRGAIADDSNNKNMTMQEIATAVTNSGVHFGVLNFDACLMAMYEVAYSLRSVTDYLVASEEIEPGQGDDYVGLLTSLTATPTQTPLQVAQMLATKFKDSYVNLTPQGKESVTKSAIATAKIGTLKTTLDDLATYLTTNLSGSGSLRTAIQAARNATTTLVFNKANRDLGLFLSALKTQAPGDATLGTKITAAQSALTAAVVKNESYSPDTKTTLPVSGMAIFLPVDGEYLNTDLADYQALGATLDAAGWKWGSFLTQLLTGSVTQDLQTGTRGDFAFAISWDNPAVDLDLYISEPNGLAAPWMGSTSSNGYLTPDSTVSNAVYEAYAAQTTVATGLYDVFINNVTGGATNVTLWYTDSTPGSPYADWQQIWTKALKDVATIGCTTNPNIIPDSQANYNDLSTNSYCDWVYYQGVLALNNTLTLSPNLPKANKTVFPAVNGKIRALKVHQRPAVPLVKDFSTLLLKGGL